MHFTILIERKGAEPLRKQVDVFGKDDETVVVAECKACAKLTRRTLQKDIEEFANLKGPISSAVRKPLRHRCEAEDYLAVCH